MPRSGRSAKKVAASVGCVSVGTSVSVQGERRNVLMASEHPYRGPFWRLRATASNCPLLAGVDPIGNTMFNRFQMPLVKLEVEHILTWDDLTDEQRLGLQGVAELCDFAGARNHKYLWFQGD